MSASPNLQLPYLDANQNQKSVTHNAALRRLDALVQVGVGSSALQAPPAAPADGQRWIVASGGTGAWAGKDLAIAAWQDGAWSFYPPGAGTLAFDAALGVLLCWTGTAWHAVAGGSGDPLAAAGLPPALDYRLTEPDCLPPGQFARLSTGSVTGAAGLLVPVAAGVLRIEHDPFTGAPLGALIEEQRTNLLLWSRAVDNAVWSKNALTIAADTVLAPDGTGTADRLTSTGADGYIGQAVVLPAGPFTASIWAKSPDAGRTMNFVVGAGGARLAAAHHPITTTWQRYAVSGNNPSSQVISIYLGGDATLPNGAVLDLWGAQLEAGAFATSVIPTTAAQATRAVDSLAVPATSDWFNPNEGTFVVDAICPPSDRARVFFEASDNANAIDRILFRNDAGAYVAYLGIAPSTYLGLSMGAAVPGTRVRAAVSYSAATLAGSVNGGAAVSVPVSGPLPTLTVLRAGCSIIDAALTAPLNRLAYFPRALAAAQLQAMTA